MQHAADCAWSRYGCATAVGKVGKYSSTEKAITQGRCGGDRECKNKQAQVAQKAATSSEGFRRRAASGRGEVRAASLATAANALGHAVELRVLSVDWIVWIIHQVFLRGHLIGARLAMAGRRITRKQLLPRVRRSMCSRSMCIWVSRTSRLRNRHGSVDQGQQRYRRDQLSHVRFPRSAPIHDDGNGKLDHKVRQASRFVQGGCAGDAGKDLRYQARPSEGNGTESHSGSFFRSAGARCARR
jgi:hypothetical protein